MPWTDMLTERAGKLKDNTLFIKTRIEIIFMHIFLCTYLCMQNLHIFEVCALKPALRIH